MNELLAPLKTAHLLPPLRPGNWLALREHFIIISASISFVDRRHLSTSNNNPFLLPCHHHPFLPSHTHNHRLLPRLFQAQCRPSLRLFPAAALDGIRTKISSNTSNNNNINKHLLRHSSPLSNRRTIFMKQRHACSSWLSSGLRVCPLLLDYLSAIRSANSTLKNTARDSVVWF